MFNNIIQILNYSFLQNEILGNTIYAWLTAAIVFLIAITALYIFRAILLAKLRAWAGKTKNNIDDTIINAIHAIHWPFYVLVSLYIALGFVETGFAVEQWSYYVILTAVVYYAIKALQDFVDFGVEKIIKKRQADGKSGNEIVKMLSAAVKFALWAGAVVLILSNLGYDVTSLVAGLGIGGIAAALALQNILSDVFSSVSIYFDKPFKSGDFIIVGDYMGVVKKIGIKTTRIQTLQGEELVISNNELTQSKIQNFGKMSRRRVVFSIGVTYDTPHEKLKKIPDIIKDIVNSQEAAEVDRVHFKSFGDSSLIYETVYYISTGDYNQYMDIQEAINLAIVQTFEKEKIEFAFPTRTVYLKK